MNNVSFGNDRAQYYETVSSGSGAGPDPCSQRNAHAGTPLT